MKNQKIMKTLTRNRITTVLFFLMLLVINMQWAECKTPSVNGIWVGSVGLGHSSKITIAFELNTENSVNISGYFDVIEQRLFNMEVKRSYRSGDSLHIAVPSLRVTFRGVVTDSTLTGLFTQGSLKPWNIILYKCDSLPVAKPRRTQEPLRPLPYYEEDVYIENPGAGVTLAGTFTRPSAGGLYPAVILIPGSGPNDRDADVFGHKVQFVLSDLLTRAGYAVLRTDDRGVAESTGRFSTATVKDLASDVIACVDYLKKRPEVDSAHIGLIGHSLGGAIAPIAASEDDDIAFIVILAGPAEPLYKIIYEQDEAIFSAKGLGSDAISVNRAMEEAVFETIVSERDSSLAMPIIRRKFKELDKRVAQLSDIERRELKLSYPLNAAVTITYFKPVNQFDYFYDPAFFLQKVKCPVLAMNGSKDIQVLPHHLYMIEKILKDSGNKNVTAKEMPGLNHLFQKCNECTLDEYGKIEETVNPGFIEELTDWLDSATGHFMVVARKL